MNKFIGLGVLLILAVAVNVCVFFLAEIGVFRGWRAEAYLFGMANIGILLLTAMMMGGVI